MFWSGINSRSVGHVLRGQESLGEGSFVGTVLVCTQTPKRGSLEQQMPGVKSHRAALPVPPPQTEGRWGGTDGSFEGLNKNTPFSRSRWHSGLCLLWKPAAQLAIELGRVHRKTRVSGSKTNRITWVQQWRVLQKNSL